MHEDNKGPPPMRDQIDAGVDLGCPKGRKPLLQHEQVTRAVMNPRMEENRGAQQALNAKLTRALRSKSPGGHIGLTSELMERQDMIETQPTQAHAVEYLAAPERPGSSEPVKPECQPAALKERIRNLERTLQGLETALADQRAAQASLEQGLRGWRELRRLLAVLLNEEPALARALPPPPPAPPPPPSMASRLAAHRREIGLSLAEMAEVIGVSAMTLSYWERGFRKPLAKHAAGINRALCLKK